MALGGVVECTCMIPLAVAMSRAIDGVVDVRSQLSYAVDDTRFRRCGT